MAGSRQTATATSSGVPQVVVHSRSIRVNTNLEQISDWLTKIIVGVTLVELGPAVQRLDTAADVIASAFGGAPSKSYAFALMLYFSITGFLGAYLLTRLFLQRAFERALDEEYES